MGNGLAHTWMRNGNRNGKVRNRNIWLIGIPKHMQAKFAEDLFFVRLMDGVTAAAVLASAFFPQDADLTRKRFRRRMRYCRALIEERLKTT